MGVDARGCNPTDELKWGKTTAAGCGGSAFPDHHSTFCYQCRRAMARTSCMRARAAFMGLVWERSDILPVFGQKSNGKAHKVLVKKEAGRSRSLGCTFHLSRKWGVQWQARGSFQAQGGKTTP